MAHESKTAIFFDDLREDAQVRLIKDELEDIVKDPFVVRYIDIDKDTYGYDPDQAKQTLEQHITVLLVDGDRRTTHPWLMVWDCMEAEFTTFMQTDQEPPQKMEGKLGKALASKSVVIYAPKENNEKEGE